MNPGSKSEYRDHFSALDGRLPGAGTRWLAELRQEALADFDVNGFPSPRDEDWRYTNVSAIERKRFSPRLVVTEGDFDAAELHKHRLPEAWTLVFVDGRFSAALSDLDGLPDGVAIDPLSTALDDATTPLQETFGQVVARTSKHGFVSFNTAFFSDGLLLHVPPDTLLPRPLQIINVAARPDLASNVRNVILLDRGARAEIVETYVTAETSGSMTVSITEAIVGEEAALDYYTLHAASERAFRFCGLYVDVRRAGRFAHTNLTLGGLLVRNEIHVDLAEAGQCGLDGLFVGQGRRHADNHTLIRHQAPNGATRENYRGILGDRSRGVFQGRIVVEPQAQKTDAQMSNRNLLLSEEAEVDTKPQLEIHADDVKCAHGVAVGQLDPEALFYLESRGVDPVSARNMLTFAFANTMVDRIALSGFRTIAQDALLSLFPQTGIRKDWL